VAGGAKNQQNTAKQASARRAVTLPGPATVSIDISSNNQIMINGKTNFEQVYLQSINKLIEIILLQRGNNTGAGS